MRCLAFVVAIVAMGIPSLAVAQSSINGFALQRFDPSYAGDRLLAVPDGTLRGHLAPAAKLTFDYARSSLRALRDNSPDATVVRDQLYLHVDAAYSVANRVKVAVDVPIALVQTGEAIGATPPVKGGQLGDMRVGARLRLTGDTEAPLALGFQADLWMPTGSVDNFTSDGTFRGHPQLSASGVLKDRYLYGLALGADIRPRHDIGIRTMGSALTFSGGVAMLLMDGVLQVGPEVFGSADFSHSAQLEALLGAHVCVSSDFVIGAGLGKGFTSAPGSPAFRGIASFAYEPNRCARTPREREKDAETPPTVDRDHDGIDDAKDACPDTPGTPSQDPRRHGCSDPNRRRSGTTDGGSPLRDPIDDRDQDGIDDSVDACPDEPGPRSDDPRKNGCRTASASSSVEAAIQQEILFETGEAVLIPESERVLRAVGTILRDHPEITSITIEGHTDSSGGRRMNLTLSERRALVVRNALISMGVAASRLVIQGYGPDVPSTSNQTPAGRRRNRAVFLIPTDMSQKAPSR